MTPEHKIASIRTIVESALKEDIGKGDLTSLACMEPNPMNAQIKAKCDGKLSGVKPVLLAFDIVDSANIIRPLKNDSDRFSVGDIIFEIEGFNQTVLTVERTALNFLGHLSGVATLTNQFVEKVKGTDCKILDTRKTTPGMRMLEKEAVTHGGGYNHRIGLFDMILIKDNHIASAGSIANAIKQTNEFLDTSDFRLQFDTTRDTIEIEVEVATIDQLTEAIDCGVKRLLLDNQSLDSLSAMVQKARTLNSDVMLEASGNVNLETVASIAQTGVDYISIGALTHSAPIADFTLLTDEN